MRNIFTLALLALSLIVGTNSTNAQAVSTGSFIIDAYYGAPNFGKSFATKVTGDNGNYRVAGISGVGPAGLRLEYMLAEKFGLGVDFIYNSTVMNLEYDSLNTDNTLYKTYTGSGTMNRVRIHARFNYHFVSNDNLDAYFGVGAGTNTRIWTAKSNDPAYNFRNTTSGTLLPVSMRLAMGMRYYFTQNIGLNAEIGVGGPVISAGLSIKI